MLIPSLNAYRNNRYLQPAIYGDRPNERKVRILPVHQTCSEWPNFLGLTFVPAAANDFGEPNVHDAAVCSNVCICQFLAGDDNTVHSFSPKALHSVGNHQTD